MKNEGAEEIAKGQHLGHDLSARTPTRSRECLRRTRRARAGGRERAREEREPRQTATDHHDVELPHPAPDHRVDEPRHERAGHDANHYRAGRRRSEAWGRRRAVSFPARRGNQDEHRDDRDVLEEQDSEREPALGRVTARRAPRGRSTMAVEERVRSIPMKKACPTRRSSGRAMRTARGHADREQCLERPRDGRTPARSPSTARARLRGRS